MRRITPRTCLWPLVGSIVAAFALSIGLTFRSNHHCYAGTCGEWLFPLQARIHVVVWYLWLSISIGLLAFRAFHVRIRAFMSRPVGTLPMLGFQFRLSGILVLLWICVLYGIAIGVWWSRLKDYFVARGAGLTGNTILAGIALTGHLADITMGMVLLPVSRHSALMSFFKLSPETAFVFHKATASSLIMLVLLHGLLYVGWAGAHYAQDPVAFKHVLPLLNPTYLFDEVWPGDTTSLGMWRASLIFTGSAAALIMFLMLSTSVAVVRRKHFNCFYFTHLLAIVAIILVCLHASTMLYCTLPGLSMWLLDWGMRLSELRQSLPARLNSIGNGWYRYVFPHVDWCPQANGHSLTAPLPRKRLSGCACHSPVVHFHIHHTGSSVREVHPFTTVTHLASKKTAITNEDESIDVQFLFRRTRSARNNQWTDKLARLIDDRADRVKSEMKEACSVSVTTEKEEDSTAYNTIGLDIRLEGPYFTAVNPELYSTVICLVAGTGLSGAIAIAADFHASRTAGMLSCGASGLNKGISNAERGKHWQRCFVIWSVREDDYVDIPLFDDVRCDGLEIQVHKTGTGRPRPDITAALKQICADDGKSSWCYISGPNGFISAAEKSCQTVKGLTWFAARWG
ncbi:hypothetical protein DOTSEDRAFT_79293 [Dothistroma septosporum NZE10]|uniref:Ferric oxidoreductase domain-containing protein n=1 Tax=Dothistroma septosporum (strain NZE10 / CBS 128990) TaxID=675120 RepID=N1PS87_DOTSN|nr:hypothetical protein DOTSEDRAFT_79293 [Dothistroma septosporum NZE10]